VGFELVQQFPDGAPCGFDGSGVDLSEQPFELGEHFLDRVQTGRVGRQEEQAAASGLEHFPDPLTFVASKIIEHNDTAGLEFRDKELLDPGSEDIAIDRAVDNARCDDAVMLEARHKGQRLPVSVRHPINQRQALRPPAVRPGHVGLHPGFVNEDKALRVYPALQPAPAIDPADDIGAALFERVERLFLNVFPHRFR
jgi:hypothetical protein